MRNFEVSFLKAKYLDSVFESGIPINGKSLISLALQITEVSLNKELNRDFLRDLHSKNMSSWLSWLWNDGILDTVTSIAPNPIIQTAMPNQKFYRGNNFDKAFKDWILDQASYSRFPTVGAIGIKGSSNFCFVTDTQNSEHFTYVLMDADNKLQKREGKINPYWNTYHFLDTYRFLNALLFVAGRYYNAVPAITESQNDYADIQDKIQLVMNTWLQDHQEN